MIPKNNDKLMRIDTGVLSRAVDRVSTISAEKSRSVKMAIEPGRLTLTVRNIEAGQAVEEAEIDYDYDALEIGFNARYILDVMGQIAGEQVELRLNDVGFADPGARHCGSGRPVRADATAGVVAKNSSPRSKFLAMMQIARSKPDPGGSRADLHFDPAFLFKGRA